METKVYSEKCLMPPTAARVQYRLFYLLDSMMNTAGHHAEQLGWGIRDLLAKGLTWVLSRYQVFFSELPRPDREFTVTTWPSGRRNLLALRDFHVVDGLGKEILKAASIWLVLNATTRRPARLEGLLPDFAPYPEPAFSPDLTPLPAPAQTEQNRSYEIKPEDIDLNNHVNNIVYLEWAIESLPAAIWTQRRLAKLDVAFLAEALRGDSVLCRTEQKKGDPGVVFLQQVQHSLTGRELTRVCSQFI